MNEYEMKAVSRWLKNNQFTNIHTEHWYTRVILI